MASLTQRGTPVSFKSVSDTNCIITKPTGVTSGDLMFAVVGTETGYTNSTPSGWTSLGQANPTYYFQLFYKLAGGSEPASYTWTTASAGRMMGTIIAYQSGQFNHVSPIEQTSNTAYVTSNTTVRAAAMTVAVANSPLVSFAMVGNGSSTTFTKATAPTTDWVEDYDDGDTNPDMWMEFCSMIWTGSGSTGNIDVTSSTTNTNKHAFAVSLNPALGVTATPAVITATFTVQTPVIAGGAVVSPVVISSTFSVQAPTVSFPAPDFTNITKHSASFTNLSKS